MTTPSIRAWLIPAVLVGYVVLTACGGQPSRVAAATASATASAVPITAYPTSPPPGADIPGAQWLNIRGAGGLSKSVQLAAILRPKGEGPFPLVIYLGGSDGLHDYDVRWASRLADGGFVVVAGCWFETSVQPGETVELYGMTWNRIGCPDARADQAGAIAALIEVGRRQPGVRQDATGLFGVSLGAGAALLAGWSRTDIRAVVSDSLAFTPDPSTSQVAVLVLGGTTDRTIEAQKGYVDTLRLAGKHVESHFYDGGQHAVIADPNTRDDATRRTIEFFTRELS